MVILTVCLSVCSLEKHESAVQVCAVTALNLAQQKADRDLHLRERGSRALLTLAKWLQQDNHLVSAAVDNDRSALGRLLAWEKARSSVNDLPIFGIMNVQSKNYNQSGWEHFTLVSLDAKLKANSVELSRMTIPTNGLGGIDLCILRLMKLSDQLHALLNH